MCISHQIKCKPVCSQLFLVVVCDLLAVVFVKTLTGILNKRDTGEVVVVTLHSKTTKLFGKVHGNPLLVSDLINCIFAARCEMSHAVQQAFSDMKTANFCKPSRRSRKATVHPAEALYYLSSAI